MAQKRNHVPKFGNFESDNDDVPYTAYFEKARQEKGTGVRMNPNDPEENPEAFMYLKKENGGRNGSRRENHRRTNSRSTTSESGSYNSNSSNFGNKDRGKNNRKKNMTGSEYFVPPSPGPDRQRKLSDVYSDMSMASVSVPKFGAWDEKDPTSGEGFTVLFNKVKEEKHIAASKFHVVPPQVVAHTKAHKEKKTKSKTRIQVKRWCCVFPREK